MAAAAAAAGAVEVVAQPTAQTVGNAFVAQYYKMLHHSPSIIHRFYQDISQLGRPEDDGTTSVTTTMTAINEKVLSLHYDDYKAEIKSVDAQESLASGVHVLVTGYMTGKDNIEWNFTQSFFLAPQDRGGYFVLNDMFQYVDKVSIPEGIIEEAPKKSYASIVGNAFVAQYYKILHHSPSIVHRFYQDISQFGRPEDDGTTSITTTMTAINEKVLSLHNDDYKAVIKSVDAQESLASGVHVLVTGYMTGKDNIEWNFAQSFFLAPQDRGGYFVLNDMFQYVDKVSIPEGIIEEAPKKSYASIVKDLKGNSLPFSSPPPAPRKTPSKSQEKKVNHAPPTVSSAEVSGAPESGKSQDGEAEGYSIYIKGLPYDATPAFLEDEFKKFGTIKNGGIQVRSKNENSWSMKMAPPLPRPPPVEPTFTCPVCMGPYVEEMSTKCGHIFCKKCIRESIAVRGQCPTCREKISMKNTIRVYLPTTK